MFQRNKNSTVYANTSPASDSGGKVSGTMSPGGAFGKTVQYANDNPFSDTNSKPGGNYHPRRLYGRRGRQQGARTKGFSGGATGNAVPQTGGFNRLAGSWTGTGAGGPPTKNISSLFTGQGAPGGAYSS